MTNVLSLLNIGSEFPWGPTILGGIYIAAVIAAVLKGFALYKAANLHEKVWFWVLVFVSTFGILDIYYLYTRRTQHVRG